MRLSHMETSFWYGCALRVAGVPAGAVYAAIRMMQWADFRHGFAVSYFEATRQAMQTDTNALHLLDRQTIDAGGVTSLIAGPLLLDRATVLARETGLAAVTARNIDACGWLGQLVELATKRGFAAQLAYTSQGRDSAALSGIYSPSRTIIGLPGPDAPWWFETDTAIENFAWTDERTAPGVTLTLADPNSYETDIRKIIAERGLKMRTPGEIAENDRRKMRDGWEADDAAWRSLAAYSFGVLAESTERSLHSAGA